MDLRKARDKDLRRKLFQILGSANANEESKTDIALTEEKVNVDVTKL